MRRFSQACLLVAAWALLACNAEPQAAPQASGVNGAGQAKVIVVAPQDADEDPSDEAYADWAAYLNDFAEAHPELKFQTVDSEELSNVTDTPPPLREPFATLFVRPDGTTAYYDGMIFEPFVYDEGARFLAAQEVPGQLEYLELWHPPASGEP